MSTDLADAIGAIWKTSSAEMARRITTLEDAAAATLARDLGDDLHARAASDAHKLAGSLAMFGLSTGSEIARKVERALGTSSRPAAEDASHLAQLVASLRKDFDTFSSAQACRRQPPVDAVEE